MMVAEDGHVLWNDDVYISHAKIIHCANYSNTDIDIDMTSKSDMDIEIKTDDASFDDGVTAPSRPIDAQYADSNGSDIGTAFVVETIQLQRQATSDKSASDKIMKENGGVRRTALRMRGGGGLTSAQIKALSLLSEDEGEVILRIFRKMAHMIVKDNTSFSSIVNSYGLHKVDYMVPDADAKPIRLSSPDEEDEDEEEHGDDFAEGEHYIGVISEYNDERNFGIITILDDCETEIFCHGSHFPHNTTLDVRDYVAFTVTWDERRDRWHAVSIYEPSEDDVDYYYECASYRRTIYQQAIFEKIDEKEALNEQYYDAEDDNAVNVLANDSI